jgi:hypothetical protein
MCVFVCSCVARQAMHAMFRAFRANKIPFTVPMGRFDDVLLPSLQQLFMLLCGFPNPNVELLTTVLALLNCLPLYAHDEAFWANCGLINSELQSSNLVESQCVAIRVALVYESRAGRFPFTAQVLRLCERLIRRSVLSSRLSATHTPTAMTLPWQSSALPALSYVTSFLLGKLLVWHFRCRSEFDALVVHTISVLRDVLVGAPHDSPATNLLRTCLLRSGLMVQLLRGDTATEDSLLLRGGEPESYLFQPNERSAAIAVLVEACMQDVYASLFGRGMECAIECAPLGAQRLERTVDSVPLSEMLALLGFTSGDAVENALVAQRLMELFVSALMLKSRRSMNPALLRALAVFLRCCKSGDALSLTFGDKKRYVR